MWILDMLKKKADSPDAAVISREQSLTYSQLWSQSETAARYILERCRTRNPVLIYGNKELEITVLMIAMFENRTCLCPAGYNISQGESPAYLPGCGGRTGV